MDTVLDRERPEAVEMTQLSISNAMKDPRLYDTEALRSGKSTPKAEPDRASESMGRKSRKKTSMQAE